MTCSTYRQVSELPHGTGGLPYNLYSLHFIHCPSLFQFFNQENNTAILISNSFANFYLITC